VPLVDAADSLFVVVDAQPGFIADGQEATVARIAWLAWLAGELGVPVVVVEEGPQRNGDTHPDVLARIPPGTPVIEKLTFGLAGHAPAVEAVQATGRGTAVLVGFETDVCVAQSAIGLRDLGLRAVVPADAVYTAGPTQHAAGLQRMRDDGVEITSTKALAFEWIREVDPAIEIFGRAREMLGRPPFEP
jgi:nicotinamidase-related amidase